jgi:peptidoglycan/LPS O-acetylase OafA/YrhL
VIAFPVVAFVVSLACALLVAADGVRRPKPDKVAWAIAFGLFAIAAGAEVAGSLAGWNVPLVRLYYLTGATLVVGFLGLGQLYLLFGRKFAGVAPGAALLVTALGRRSSWTRRSTKRGWLRTGGARSSAGRPWWRWRCR